MDARAPTNERQERAGWGMVWALQSVVTGHAGGAVTDLCLGFFLWLFLRFEHNLVNGQSFQLEEVSHGTTLESVPASTTSDSYITMFLHCRNIRYGHT